MDNGLIPRRYAKALYKFAQEKGQAQRVYALMKELANNFETQRSLHEVMANPFVASADKLSLLITASGAEKKDICFNDFIKLLFENKRIDMIRDIALSYMIIYRKDNNIRKVEVVTASQLAPEVEMRLKDMIVSHLNGGTMEYTITVNPELIGGFVITIDSERLDASINNELKQLRLKLLSNN